VLVGILSKLISVNPILASLLINFTEDESRVKGSVFKYARYSQMSVSLAELTVRAKRTLGQPVNMAI